MNMASMAGYYDPAGGMMLRAQVGMSVSNFIDNIPNMSDYEIGHAFGYGVEKLAESVALTRGLGLGTNVVARGSGRIFYVGEGAETLARNIASQTGYKTIYNTWYGALGQRVTPFLSQSASRSMWGHLSAKFANGAKYGDDIITVFGRHRSTGLHTLPINSRAAWKAVEFPILQSKGIPYRPILTK